MLATTAAAAARLPDEIAALLVDPAAYADDRIHEAHSWMRANNPVGLAEPEGYKPFWAISRHADILDVSRQNALFSSELAQLVLMSRESDDNIRKATGGSPHISQSLIAMDGADHRAYRMLTQSYFMPANLRRTEGHIRELARATVDKMMATGGSCDFVSEIAVHYPLQVVMGLLGVPDEDFPRILRWAQEVFAPQDPDIVRDRTAADVDAHAKTLLVSLGELQRYFQALAQDRRQTPRQDLASLIANSTVQDHPIGDTAASAYYVILATAGHDTTSSSTAGTMRVFAERPDLFAKVKADPALIPSLLEEVIRWETPVKTFMRVAARDTEFAGRRIAKGDNVLLCYASGNRDEAVFEDPFSFRIDRKPNAQLAFGYGAHMCLGQHLARLEMRLLFEELLPRLGAVASAGPPVMIQSSFVNGLKSLPITFTPA